MAETAGLLLESSWRTETYGKLQLFRETTCKEENANGEPMRGLILHPLPVDILVRSRFKNLSLHIV